MSEHTLEWLLWGPLLLKTTITDEFRADMLRRAYNTTGVHNSSLAGHIKKENYFEKEDADYFAEQFEPYVNAYRNKLNQYMQLTSAEKTYTKWDLGGLWVNFMENGEYNPPHIHDGAVSFVIYLDVPEEIQKESENYNATHRGPGTIDFMYGENIHDIRTHYNFTPKNNDMFMFHAHLRHWVSPFISNKTRISMSGNITFR